MLVDEGNSWNLPAKKRKACNVVGGERASLVTLDLSYVEGGRRREERCEDRRDDQKRK